jgi:hypothetical protein
MATGISFGVDDDSESFPPAGNSVSNGTPS